MSEDYYLSILKEGINKEFNFYPYDSFSDINLSGFGGFGNVYQAKYRDADMLVALKSYEANSNLKEIVNERTVDVHENIIRFLGVTKNEGDKYLLVLQWADGGTLRSYLEMKFINMNWNKKLQFATQITRCWQNDPDLRPTMDQVYDSLKKVDLNSPVFRITSSNISLPSTTVLPITDLLDIEICVNGFLTNIIHQNNDISIQHEDDSALNSQANELWNIFDNSTNIGKDFTQISEEIIEYHRQKRKDNGIERATNRLKEMSSSSISKPTRLASFLVPTLSNN
ncbi:12194_t:CDS:2 [Dentiscutata heterogama]|uniref:12194_t:CDS:1 n=1 Tax=Dentiscutata heterogama TaxID=1316150 RepID=A0ACA9M318_9GLOM|nr:12194_t:CDS:2 [Dentiscutata heterogama]